MNDKTTEQIYLHLTLTSVVFESNNNYPSYSKDHQFNFNKCCI